MINSEFSDSKKGFHFFKNLIENNNHFSFSRWNDGEIGLVLKTEPVYSTIVRKWTKEIESEAKKLRTILNKPLKYYVGVCPYYLRKKEDMFFSSTNSDINFINSHIFHHLSIQDFKNFLTLLKTKNTIIVGPDYLTELNFYKEHIVTPLEFVWKHVDVIESNIITKINKYDNVIIVYSASIATNILIDRLYDKFQNKITQIDIGSNLDPYCGVFSRSGHKKFMEDNKIPIKKIITRK